MKSKLLPILLVVLILLNGVLIFMLIKKPHLNRKNNAERGFLIEQLQFSEEQQEKFKSLDNIHRKKMLNFDQRIRKQKDILFNSFADETKNIDSLATVAGNLEIKKELEVFHFFKSVRKICTSEQQKKFDVIINNAIKGNNSRPPVNGENHLPRREGMPPRGEGMPPPPG
ncbi:hypothetical protein BW723_11275 [Polaribacter reichenbachii]|uniref:Periplasmic heavy metal sensor n=1 Tax=Polaribacter reichenbachii TaxID=996801 RepID=A0A1B8TPU0_9FLAO|nr:hypothetical protein [Polaribacter reichenbachii]APZ46828.1 hypothetical protein BW723_11275 [Polaribacter reichenbachii]AUC17471.1 hypothetical protein BTO17_01720 [Polaribacter reichenbachii]OBY61653.1 hypothetical protein LPB301_16490 [Polaribacter reichenbachii]